MVCGATTFSGRMFQSFSCDELYRAIPTGIVCSVLQNVSASLVPPKECEHDKTMPDLMTRAEKIKAT